MYEMAIGAPKHNNYGKLGKFIKPKFTNSMQNVAENILNKNKCYLSLEAKKRLRWIYIITYECNGNVTKSANKIGVSRQWLSTIYNKWKNSNKNPKSLEPISKAPKNTSKRKKVNKEVEDKIIEVRKKYHWGKDKLKIVLERDEDIIVGATTINRYLSKHGLLDIKISNKNRLAHKNKVEQKQKTRPPTAIKDYKPGALIEKDMKFILKRGKFVNFQKYKAKENFWIQHTVIDSFTRIRVIGLTRDSSSQTAVTVQKECVQRMPFKIACMNTDNGSENEKSFNKYLEKENIIHFYSRTGTPTDNPRVERSHLTDDNEFYNRGNIYKTFKEQKDKLLDWEHIYNYVRPHQALGNLTPIEFYDIWKDNPKEAHAIADKWNNYLKKERLRLASSRKIKKKEKIDKLMQQIDIKLTE